MSYTYLASPYTHPDPLIRTQRYLETCKCFVWLLNQRIWTYSPIIHCHEVALDHNLPTDAAFWSNYNCAMLSPANRLLILCLDGWQDSKGVSDETLFAHNCNIPIEFIHPTTYAITEESRQ